MVDICLILGFLVFSAMAGLLSGIPGIKSVPGPQLPSIDFLNRFNGLTFMHMLYVLIDDMYISLLEIL